MATSPILIATDLTEFSEPALVRGHMHAAALGVPFVVVHVIPDVLRHYPLLPSRGENDAKLALDLTKKAADLVSEQVSRVLHVPASDYRVNIEVGAPEDEIVRVAEESDATLVVVGGKPREGSERYLGHVAERVVRYSPTSVLVARPGTASRRVLVATDFGEGSLPAVKFGGVLVEKAKLEVTLLHAMQLPGNHPFMAVASALGSPWMPPPQGAIEKLEELGLATLEGLAKQYHFSHFEQVEVKRDPAETILERADAIDAEAIVMGSQGRTGLRRLVLGSTAEKVIRLSRRSVLVTRDT
ncbi:Universal stress protein family [Labilithrix luteola]|uniref:Universal stress protein family n=1 Tax=Labilithrix luteola TaxID=1391654 RepID=A0A0K1PZ91_9BACT|nr:universal stress protein [Labilithrix luteola]AKU98807.1 Universal stress protein family [Labilithrix luteola]